MKKQLLLSLLFGLMLNCLGYAQTVTIGSVSSQFTYTIFNMQDPYTRHAALYSSSEIGTNGIITSLGWNLRDIWSNGDGPVKVYLKSVSSNSLSPDTWANTKSGATLVYDGQVTFPSTANDTWFTLNLATAFTYSSGNLLVLVESNYGGSGNGNSGGDIDFNATTVSGKSLYWWGDPIQTTGSTSTVRPIFQIGFDLSSDVNNFNSTAEKDFTIFPNPASQTLNYSCNGSETNTLAFYNLSGALIYTEQLSGKKQGCIDVSMLPKGFYMVCIKSNNSNIYKKLIVE